MADLKGRIVAFLEARHADEMASLITRHKGVAYPAPCLREVHRPEAPDVVDAVQRVARGEVDLLVFMTGAGADTMLRSAREQGIEAEFLAGAAEVEVAARGPKAENAVRRLGMRVDLSAPAPYTSEALLNCLRTREDLAGKRVLVQLFGSPLPAFVAGLEEMGAVVNTAMPYTLERPSDPDAVVRLIEDLQEGWVQARAVTTGPQVKHLLGIAKESGHADALRAALSNVTIAAQGAVCATALQAEGLQPTVIPKNASMGALVRALAQHFEDGQDIPQKSAPSVNSSHRVVAVIGSRGYKRTEDVQALVESLPGDTVLLTGSGRGVAQTATHTAIMRGLAVRTLEPTRAEEAAGAGERLVRAAAAVVVYWDGRSTEMRRVIRLAEQYAKPLHVVKAASA